MNSEELKHCPFCGCKPMRVHEENEVQCSHVFCCAFAISMDNKQWNARADQPWYRMDSAPRDGSDFIVKFNYYDDETVVSVCVASFNESGEIMPEINCKPLAWTPLPNTDAPIIHTYNPETHMLIERAKVPEGLKAALDRENTFLSLMFCDHGKIDKTEKSILQVLDITQAAALVAEGV